MERSDRRARKEKKHPRVPIKTYHWEDVRRSRRKGGYPWTHLYKQPFDEDADPEPFTMEALRKSRSASTIGKHEEGVDISEVASEKNFGDFLETPEKMETLQIITEPDDHSSKNSYGSLNIEECEASDTEKQSQKPENPETNIGLESAESSDNISQYLDKEDRGPKAEETVDNSEESSRTRVGDEANGKPEEESKRKRKLSAESSYSRISQTKMAVLKKLKDAKNKIKVPKLTFPTSKIKKPAAKKKNSPPASKKAVAQPKNANVKPVYVHIPLKPPPGQSDEFSYLEFGEKTDMKPPPAQRPSGFRDLLKKLKETNVEKEESEHLREEETIEAIPENQEQVTVKEEDKNVSELNAINDEQQDIEDVEMSNVSESKDVIVDNDVEMKILSDIDVASKVEDKDKIIIPAAAIPELNPEGETKKKIFAIGTENSSLEDEIPTTPEESGDPNEIFDDLFKAGASKVKETQTKTTTSERTVRSKSAEPERKRKLSMESSYSRKSLSKLGIMKKLREAKDKIKSSFSKSNVNKEGKDKTPAIKKAPKQEQKQLKIIKPVEPVYIHIPLKPTEGEVDEFSKSTSEPETSPPNEDTNTVASTPDSIVQGADGVQFIYLTAPSDDEILDYHGSDVPETPSSENTTMFFVGKIDELKVLAKDIVDNISPGTVKAKLDPVSEETNGDKTEETNGDKTEETDEAKPEAVEEPKKDVEISEKMTIDVEDGLSEATVVKSEMISEKPDESKEEVIAPESLELNLSSEEASATPDEAAEHKSTSELKSSLKGEGSPVMKKKVSFKRRSRTPKDGIYEEIQAPAAEGGPEPEGEPEEPLENSQSMSVDEEKTDLDEKIVQNTSLEEDYNKWSQINDHEYEPVNPPPDDEAVLTLTPAVHLTDTNNKSTSLQPVRNVVLDTPMQHQDIKSKEDVYRAIEMQFPRHAVGAPIAEASVESNASQPEKAKEGPGKFQLAFKQKTDQFKNKIHNMKRPSLTMPNRPKFQKPNFQKFKIEKPKMPKLNLPKIPDTARINLPSFSLPRRNTSKRTLKQRQLSTESNDGDSKKPLFDFSTYPRIFKKKPKAAEKSQQEEIPDFATVPRSKNADSKKTKHSTKDRWSGSDSIRVPLHSEDSMDVANGNEMELPPEYDREDSVERRMAAQMEYDREDSVERRMASHIRYDDDIDIDDEFDRETADINKDDYLNRWQRGNFNMPEPNQEDLKNFKNSQYKVTDLDSPDIPDYNSNNNKENYSSGSSLGVHRRGVLEEINSDEFFLRQKGISQDNIEVGQYLSSEIREAFRTPTNALSQMQDYERGYDPRGSNQSLPEVQNKKKPVKKPKRKKTPHVSQEQIPYFEESADDDLDVPPPARPKRRSKKTKKPPKYSEDIIPHQDTISIDTSISGERLMDHRESLGGILGDDECEVDSNLMYENEFMQGKGQPDVFITDPYRNFQFVNMSKYQESFEREDDRPEAPPRKQKSLKSLNMSENGSILGDFIVHKDIQEPEVEVRRVDTKFDTQVSLETPKRPSRQRSRTSLQSREPSEPVEEVSLQKTDSAIEDQVPCVEEPCVQDIRDSMGYAIIDKQRPRDPPLPPPRTPPRRKRSIRSNKSSTPESKFFTVPRSHGSGGPVRPLRNYSTLGQVKKNSDASEYAEDKENIDITQYIEIEDRNLQSGDVIQKMKGRPLPAPPRPPRKTRNFALRDITSTENIISAMKDDHGKQEFDETEVSTQTEPLPDDFVCEEVIQEATDTVLTPSRTSGKEKPEVRRILITPTHYTHEETITHGSLVVEPLNGAKILSGSEITTVSRERIIPVSYESDFDETSSIPDDFRKLKDPPQETTHHGINPEMDVLKAHKLQVTDLDIDTLTVNKLLAGKIVVSEIDSSSITTNEIGSKSGALKVGEIELPSEVIQEIIRSIRAGESEIVKKDEEVQSHPGERPSSDESSFSGQKKNFGDRSTS